MMIRLLHTLYRHPAWTLMRTGDVIKATTGWRLQQLPAILAVK